MSVSSSDTYQVNERKKSNLAFAFICLGKEKANDMSVFYTFCRVIDDIADEENDPLVKEKLLMKWKDLIEDIFTKDKDLDVELAKELRLIVNKYSLPKEPFLDLIDGCLLDTKPANFISPIDTKKYCYQVASTVGIISVRIFGCKGKNIDLFAKSLGYALQYTNILRDHIEDYEDRKRIYIPASEREFFGVKDEDFAANAIRNENFKNLLKLQYFRAKHYFNKARLTLEKEDKKYLKAAFIMWEIYEGILEKIRKNDFCVNYERVKFSKQKKMFLALKAIIKPRFTKSSYKKIAVLGGGISGMSFSIESMLKGYDVDLYEAKKHLGGKCSSFYSQKFNSNLDNGQHIISSCYKNFLKFINIIGKESEFTFQKGLAVNFVSQNDEFVKIHPLKTSSNTIFGLNKALNDFSLISASDKKNFKIFGLKILLGICKTNKNQTALDWVLKNNQSTFITENFWEIFCISALNTPLEKADAGEFKTVLKKSFFNILTPPNFALNKSNWENIFSKNIDIYFESLSNNVYRNSPITKLEFNGSILERVYSDKTQISADYFVSSLPAKNLCSLMPQSHILSQITKFEYSDILSIYIKTDKKIFNFAKNTLYTLVGSKIHWIFEKENLCVNENEIVQDFTDKTQDKQEEKYLYSLTISGANGITYTKDDIYNELKKYFASSSFQITDFLPVLSKNATLSLTNNVEKLRSKQNTIYSNFGIIGDWTKTGLPCTIESASTSAKKLKF